MRSPNRTSRRDFVCAAGLVTVGEARAFGLAEPPADPNAVLAKLVEGNKRFINGQLSLLSRRRPEDFAALAEGQAPCSGR